MQQEMIELSARRRMRKSSVSESRPLCNELIAFGAHPQVLPTGTEAIHAAHGWVFIQAARGNRRQVIWYVDVIEEQSGETLLQARVEWVWISELKPCALHQRPGEIHALFKHNLFQVADPKRFSFSVKPDCHADLFGIRCLTKS